MAFFNGEGGNVNPRGREKTNGVSNYQWFEDLADNLKESRGNVYGRTLCAMAQECLTDSKYKETVAYGSIVTTQYVHNSVRKATGYSALAYEAGKAYQAEAATKTMSHPWKYTSPTTGEVFVIGSKFHASNIISSGNWDTRLQRPKGDLVDMELNVFMLGKELAFVTVPGEPFDYYFNEDGSNAWNNLLDDTYGRPFVLGYCNGAKGYIPNSKAYDYNLGSTKWQRGSYESAITPFEKGTGEEMIRLFGAMLERLQNGESYGYRGSCAHCEGDVLWEAYNGKKLLTTGHYYLLEDTMAPQLTIDANATVCFDLNGHTIKGATRAFYTKTGGNAVLNLMNLSPAGDGAALGCGGPLGAGSGYGGGAILVDKGNTLNLYGGQLGVYEKAYHSVLRGGTIRNNGTVNMYGGTVLASKASSHAGDYVDTTNTLKTVNTTGLGATVNNAGTFRMYGGKIEAGSLELITGSTTKMYGNINVYSEVRTPLDAKGICVYSEGKFYICGAAVVEDLCVADATGKQLVVDNKTAPFTGSLHLSFNAPFSGSGKVGSATADAALGSGSITVEGGIPVKRIGMELFTDINLLLEKGSETSYYGSLAAALQDYNGGVIRLMTNLSDSVTVTKPVCIDLNGYCITGSITVSDGGILYGKDSQTDDYTVDDEFAYGLLTNVKTLGSGTVTGYGENGETYVKITEKAGVSFHKADLRISTIGFRPGTIGLYYKSLFKGDEVVADNVRSYGICLSVENSAAAQAMTPGTYSAYTGFLPGEAGNQGTSTMVANIMRTGNTAAVNTANAETQIYGCAYLQTEDGFLFGAPVAQSLRQTVEAVDKQWRTLTDRQRDFVLSIRYRYSSVVEKWEIPNILS